MLCLSKKEAYLSRIPSRRINSYVLIEFTPKCSPTIGILT